MNEQQIKDRIAEIRKLQEHLYTEEFELGNKLTAINADKLRAFLIGKVFTVKLSRDYKKLYLVNTKFKPSDLSKNGVSDYHESFYYGDISVYCDDGDITISCDNFQKLLEYAKQMKFELDFSNIREQETDLSELLEFLKNIK